MTRRVDIQVATAAATLPSHASLRRWARAALTGMRRRKVAVTLRIVGKQESARLNARYRRKDKPTNVLSFPFEPPPGARSDLLGDIVICADVVRREARAQGKAERSHWAHMVVHGILHLRGFDHQNNRDAAAMESREARVLGDLGFPNPYA